MCTFCKPWKPAGVNRQPSKAVKHAQHAGRHMQIDTLMDAYVLTYILRSVQTRVRTHTHTNIIHSFRHTYIHTYIHTYMHAHLRACMRRMWVYALLPLCLRTNMYRARVDICYMHWHGMDRCMHAGVHGDTYVFVCMHLICSPSTTPVRLLGVWPVPSSRAQDLITSRATVAKPETEKNFGTVGELCGHLYNISSTSSAGYCRPETCLHKEFVISWGRSWSESSNKKSPKQKSVNAAPDPAITQKQTLKPKASRLRTGSKPELTIQLSMSMLLSALGISFSCSCCCGIIFISAWLGSYFVHLSCI